MSFLRTLIKLSVVLACAAGGFGGAQAYVIAKSEAAPVVVATADPIAAKLAEDSDLTGVQFKGTMSPIYPTTKYTKAQLATPVKKSVKAKVALRKHNMPVQLAYAPR